MKQARRRRVERHLADADAARTVGDARRALNAALRARAACGPSRGPLYSRAASMIETLRAACEAERRLGGAGDYGHEIVIGGVRVASVRGWRAS